MLHYSYCRRLLEYGSMKSPLAASNLGQWYARAPTHRIPVQAGRLRRSGNVRYWWRVCISLWEVEPGTGAWEVHVLRLAICTPSNDKDQQPTNSLNTNEDNNINNNNHKHNQQHSINTATTKNLNINIITSADSWANKIQQAFAEPTPAEQPAKDLRVRDLAGLDAQFRVHTDGCQLWRMGTIFGWSFSTAGC